MCFDIIQKMGQIFSNLWKNLRSKPRTETPLADHQPNHYTICFDASDEELKSHCIDIIDHHVEPFSGSSPVEIIKDHENNLKLSTTTSHIVVDLNNGNGKDATTAREEREEPYIDHGDEQVLPEFVLEKNVLNTTMVKQDARTTKESEEPAIEHGNEQVLPEYVLEKNVLNITTVEQDATTTNESEEPAIDHGNEQVLPEFVLEKNVTTAVVNRVPKQLVRKIGHYSSDQRLLMVGEGDFSFSACLAVAFGASAHNITATSLNSKDYLTANYANFIRNKAALETRGSRVLHGIDATKMAKHPVIGSMVFDCIIFNFPHTGEFGRTNYELCLHQKLVRDFLKNAKKMIGEDGEIHITSKSNGFFRNWDIAKLGSDQGLNIVNEVTFNRSQYPGYNTKFGFRGDKNFHCYPSKTYKFALSAEMKENYSLVPY